MTGSTIFRLSLLLSLAYIAVAQDYCNSSDSFNDQLQCYRQQNPDQQVKLTLSHGAPLQAQQMQSLNNPLLRSAVFRDVVLHALAEKTPERLVHAGGNGAYGVFEVTDDFTDVTKAKMFSEVGKKTPLLARFSLNLESKGVPETFKSGRGLAVRFDTEDGFFSLLSVNVPVFPFKDAIRFAAFGHAAGKNSVTNTGDANMLWDLVLNGNEAFFTAMFVLTDYMTPWGYDHMIGYNIHTYQLENVKNQTRFARFYWLPDLGVKNMNSTYAAQLAISDPSYLSRQIYNKIAAGNFPSWSLYAQVLKKKDVKNARNAGLDVFDLTRHLFFEDYPLRKVGTMKLTENVKNNFAEIEQAVFCPSHLVPGILGAPDDVFESRMLGYQLSQSHRLGANFHNIPINIPKNSKVYTYNRMGPPPVGDGGGDAPTYYPNSFHGPAASAQIDTTTIVKITTDPSPTNFGDVDRWYTKEFTASERKVLVQNGVGSLSLTAPDIRSRVVELFSRMSKSLHDDIVAGFEAAGVSYT